ncbi:restriction endonuclease subunit S [Pseudomonas aeruginosa]
MSELTRHKFSDLYHMASGISSKPEQAGHGAPFLSFSAVFNNYFLPNELSDRMDTSEDEQKKYSINEGDIFLTRTSEVVDELGMSSVALKSYPQSTYSGFLKRLRPRKEKLTYPKFMAFYLRSYLFRKAMTNNAVLTLRASLNEEIFSYVDLLLPNYGEQVKIGDFLYLLSKKVDCNNRINAELEAMTRALYDYWFVQFDFPDANGRPYKSSGGKMVYNATLKREIPAGWRVEPLLESCEVVDCLHSKKPSSSFESEAFYLLQLENILNNGQIDLSSKYFVSRDDYKKWTSRIQIKEHDIVMTNAGRVAAFAQVPAGVVCGIGRNITAIRPNSIQKKFFFLSLSGRDVQAQIISNLDQGAFFKSFNVKGIKVLNLLRPDTDLECAFEQIVTPFIRKRHGVASENQQLTQLRDWLLPMLMNGQVTVP